MWTVTSPAADSLFALSNLVLIIGAALVLGGTIASIKLAAVKERFADIRLSDNELASNVAKSDAAKANERARGLEKEAAAARLETEKLKAVVAWRTLSESQATAFEKTLATKPGSVNLRWTDGDPEALFFAIQISQILQRAHWQVAPGAFKPANRIAFGIVLPPDAGNDTQTLREAFAVAKIGVSFVPFPNQGASFNVSIIKGAPFLMIGSRLPVAP